MINIISFYTLYKKMSTINDNDRGVLEGLIWTIRRENIINRKYKEFKYKRSRINNMAVNIGEKKIKYQLPLKSNL